MLQNLIKFNEVIPYAYNELQVKGFEEIICKFLADVPSSIAPTLIHMLGIPAAGKSTFCQNNKEQFKDYLFVSFDAIMEAHPEYQKDVEELGSVEAFARWEIPARVAGYELLTRAIKEKKNILMDHGGSPKCHQELLINIKKFGYKTKMFYIYCPIDIAIERAKAREIITKRHTPPQLIADRVISIEQSVNVYRNIVDEFIKVG